MRSTRLPGKVLLDIVGAPMLQHVVERTKLSKIINQVVVATTTEQDDDLIETFCRNQKYNCIRGSHFDVMDRYYQAATTYQADVVVRITSDCPLIDPTLIDSTIQFFLGVQGMHQPYEPTKERPFYWDFTANRLPPPWGRTYPIGLDVEVCSFRALAKAWREARLPHQREHVMPYMYEDILIADSRDLPGYYTQISSIPEPPRFKSLLVNHAEDFGHLRWAVDKTEDLELARRILTHFKGNRHFSWMEILEYVQSEPGLLEINASVKQKELYDL